MTPTQPISGTLTDGPAGISPCGKVKTAAVRVDGERGENTLPAVSLIDGGAKTTPTADSSASASVGVKHKTDADRIITRSEAACAVDGGGGKICRHRKTWIIAGGYYEWCYQCGAIRKMENYPPNGCYPISQWVRPTGPNGPNPAIPDGAFPQLKKAANSTHPSEA